MLSQPSPRVVIGIFDASAKRVVLRRRRRSSLELPSSSLFGCFFLLGALFIRAQTLRFTSESRDRGRARTFESVITVLFRASSSSGDVSSRRARATSRAARRHRGEDSRGVFGDVGGHSRAYSRSLARTVAVAPSRVVRDARSRARARVSRRVARFNCTTFINASNRTRRTG